MAGRAQNYWDGTCDTEWEGQGTPESPFLITSAQELAGLAARTNGDETFEGICFRLTADVWLSDPALPDEEKPLWVPIGSKDIHNGDPDSNPGGFYGTEHWFKGNFDGAGHTVHNLWYAHDSEFEENWNDPFNDGTYDFDGWYKALFGLLDGASVSNLGVDRASIQCSAQGAVLAVTARNSSFKGITVGGFVLCGTSEDFGGHAGGLVDESEGCTFEDCESRAKVRSVSSTGGFVGTARGSSFHNCRSTGGVTGLKSLGGFAGWTGEGTVITGCHSSATVTQHAARRQGADCGGFVGVNSGGVIRECSSTGDLHVYNNGAGFAGECWNYGLIESCWSTSDIHSGEYGINMASFISSIGDNEIGGVVTTLPGRCINCFGTGGFTYAEVPAGVGSFNRFGGFAGGIMGTNVQGTVVANCFYDKDRNPLANSFDPSVSPVPTWSHEFGLTTEYMQSADFVAQLNEMAAVAGTSLWRSVPGGYPVPTGVKADASYAPFAGGEGTEASPYLISNKEGLEKLAALVNHGWMFHGQHLRQTADIALNAPQDSWGEEMPALWTPIGTYDGKGHSFTFRGTYDGGMHTVRNLYIDNNTEGYAGLFGVLGDDAHIRNLGVTDAWVEHSNGAGILVGATKIHNDESEGDRWMTRCWTSGTTGGGGIVGHTATANSGSFHMTACYSTAKAAKGLVDDSNTYFYSFDIVSSWYAAPERQEAAGEPIIWIKGMYGTYFDMDQSPVGQASNLRAHGRTTAYMQSRDFVNDLNLAAAIKGTDAGWRYNEGQYPSFAGEEPGAVVTLDDGMGGRCSFRAYEGASLGLIEMPGREGYTLTGWYTDEGLSDLFVFGRTTVRGDLTLHARWTQGMEPDYDIFRNKFATTYTIRTPQQLLAFANIANGVETGILDTPTFKGKTVRLGNDIAVNDTDGFDLWGTSVVPSPSTPAKLFEGTFDGQGHTITGLYSVDRPPLFEELGSGARVSDLILQDACMYLTSAVTYDNGLLAMRNKGEVTRCGVKGRVYGGLSDTERRRPYVAGLAGQNARGAVITECFADIDISLHDTYYVGGLVGYNEGTLSESFATGHVSYVTDGGYGGVVMAPGGTMSHCYSAVALDISYSGRPTVYNTQIGGAWGTQGAAGSPVYYDRDLVAAAFDQYEEQYAQAAYSRGTALGTAEMKAMASYEGWDFEGVWGRRADRNGGYPYLRWTAPGLENDEDGQGSGLQAVGGVFAGGKVEITSMQGMRVFAGRLRDARLPRGQYIIRAGSSVRKITVR